MRRNGTMWILTAALACAALPARAQQLSEARIQELIKQAALRVSRGNTPEGQAQTQAPADTRPVVRLTKQDLDKQEEDLSRMIAGNADETLVIKQVDKVEAIRAHMNKMRTLMLLHERQVLTPDQRIRLNKLHEQWEKDHKRPQTGSR